MAAQPLVRYRAEFAAVQLVRACLRLMPMTMVRRCGGLVGRLVSFVDRFHRQIALANLAHAFPSRTNNEQRSIARAMFAHFGRLLLELLKFSTLTDAQIIERVEVDGEEHVQHAYRQEKGVLFFTGHFGYWEMIAIGFALRVQPVAVLARPLDNPYLHTMLERIRTRSGNTVIYRQGAVRKVLRELESNHGVAFLIDQHMHNDAVYVEFFNRPAATTSALAALALRTGAPVIPTFALPAAGGRYRLVFERPVPPPHDAGPEAIREFTQRCTDVLEMYVRRDPHLWLWMHRRWRDGESTAFSRRKERDVRSDLPDLERLLIVSPNWLGDAVMALPAIADVRRRFPAARLVMAARRSIAGLFTMTPMVDEVVILNSTGGAWRRSTWRSDVRSLRDVDADAAVLLPNSFASAWLAQRAGVPERWGYRLDWRGPLLTRAIEPPAIRVHQAEYYRRLVRGLGVENGVLEAAVTVPTGALHRAREILGAHGWRDPDPIVVMAPGAAYGGAKRWPAEYFADLAARLAREQRVQTVLVGSAADGATTRWVRNLVTGEHRSSVLDIAGETTLETLAGVMSLARACVSNDSGAMHLAAAVGVPLVALFGPTRERETAPVGRSDGRVEVVINHVWCRPCMLRECPLDHRCMTGLSPDKVLAHVIDAIADSESRVASPGSRIPSPGSRVPDPEP